MVLNTIKNSVKKLLSSQILRPLSEHFAGHGTCLMYHRISEEGPKPRDVNPSLQVTIKEFDKQIAFLAKNYNCMSLPDVVETLKTGTLPKNSVLVTFDDGYLDNFQLALSVLQKYQVPATFYVTSGFIDQNLYPWWDELNWLLDQTRELRIVDHIWPLESVSDKQKAFQKLRKWMVGLDPSGQKQLMDFIRSQAREPFDPGRLMMNWKELKEVDQEKLITIGAHTQRHDVLTRLRKEELFSDFIGVKKRLETELGHPIEHCSYPFGGRNEAYKREFKAAKQAGFLSGTTTREGHLFPIHRDYLFSLPRIGVYHRHTMDDFKYLLSGAHLMVTNPGGRIVTS